MYIRRKLAMRHFIEAQGVYVVSAHFFMTCRHLSFPGIIRKLAYTSTAGLNGTYHYPPPRQCDAILLL